MHDFCPLNDGSWCLYSPSFRHEINLPLNATNFNFWWNIRMKLLVRRRSEGTKSLASWLTCRSIGKKGHIRTDNLIARYFGIGIFKGGIARQFWSLFISHPQFLTPSPSSHLLSSLKVLYLIISSDGQIKSICHTITVCYQGKRVYRVGINYLLWLLAFRGKGSRLSALWMSELTISVI